MHRESERDFIYFPSLSNGQFGHHLKDDYHVCGKIPCRYYASENGTFRHPYILISAGHNLKAVRSDYGLEDDVLVLGDSGGYQICSGAVKWKPELKETVFEWLEKNTDIAMNLDIPPRAAWDGKFRQALDISLENFEYFQKNQTGNTIFLNVLQGRTEDQVATWYNEVKDFNFQGWAIGGAATFKPLIMRMIAEILNTKEHLKPQNKYLHILGVSSIEEFFMLSVLQKALRDAGSEMRVTTDSSSPNRAVIFGTYYLGFSLRNLAYETLKMPYRENAFREEYSIPYVTKFDDILKEYLTYDVIEKWEGDAISGITLHNLQVFLDVLGTINDVVHADAGFMEQLFTGKQKKLLKFFNSIQEMVQSDQPLLVYEKYKSLYDSISTLPESTANAEKFFEF